MVWGHLDMYPGSHNIRIKGRVVNINLARIVYKCEVCLGNLKKQDAGLVCKDNPAHRGFVHRDEADKIAQERLKQLQEVESVYEIRDGQIVVKNGG